MKQYKEVKNLLSKGTTNSKTAKNSIRTFILYLAPHNLNVKNKTLCAFASKGCIESCLYSAGRGAFSNVQNLRINKANYFVTDKIKFLTQLLFEIKREIEKASKQDGYCTRGVTIYSLNDIGVLDFLMNCSNFYYYSSYSRKTSYRSISFNYFSVSSLCLEYYYICFKNSFLSEIIMVFLFYDILACRISYSLSSYSSIRSLAPFNSSSCSDSVSK